MRKTTVLIALALAAFFAPAAFAAGAMPDSSVAAGAISVKVVQGKIETPLAGATVHLVAIGMDGSFAKDSRVTGEDGRVLFTGLSRDGKVAYHVLSLVGEDRLESKEPIVPSGKSGYKVVLATGEVDRDLSKPSRFDSIPAGEVWVVLHGKPAGASSVALRDAAGKTRLVGTVETDTKLGSIAKLRDVPAGTDRVWVPEATAGTRTYYAQPLMMSTGAGVLRVISGELAVQAQIGGGLDEDHQEDLEFDAEFQLSNLTAAPVDPGPDGLAVPLPGGALSVRVEESRATVEPGRGIVWRGPVPPGATKIMVHWRMKPNGDQLSFELANHEAGDVVFRRSALFFEKLPGASLAAPEGIKPDEMPSGTRKYWVMAPFDLQPGAAIGFAVSGLPQLPAWQRTSKLVVGIMVAGLLLLGLWLAVVTPARTPPEQPESTSRRKELQARREALFEELVRLERQRADGLANDRYERERAQTVAELTLVLREIDAAGTQSQAA